MKIDGSTYVIIQKLIKTGLWKGRGFIDDATWETQIYDVTGAAIGQIFCVTSRRSVWLVAWREIRDGGEGGAAQSRKLPPPVSQSGFQLRAFESADRRPAGFANVKAGLAQTAVWSFHFFFRQVDLKFVFQMCFLVLCDRMGLHFATLRLVSSAAVC